MFLFQPLYQHVSYHTDLSHCNVFFFHIFHCQNTDMSLNQTAIIPAWQLTEAVDSGTN